MTNPSPPSICPVVAGPLQAWLDTGATNTLAFLGWTINGAEIEEVPFIDPIYSDENGGERGGPIDYQFFNVQHRITLEMTKFQPAQLAYLSNRYNPNVTSSAIGVGMLLGCNSATFRLLLWAPNFVRNYLATVPTEPIQQSPVGSQHTRARVTLTANPVGGVLYNNVTT